MKKKGKILTKRCEQVIFRIQHFPVCIWLSVILFLGLVLKLVYFWLDPTVSRDGCLYIRLAQSWYDTGVFPDMASENSQNWTPPFLLFLIKSLMYFGLSAETAGFALNIVLGTFTPLLSYGVALEITQRKDIAVCSALLTAVHPAMNTLSVAIQRDMVYLFLIGLCLWFISAGIRRKQWMYWVGAGTVCGCAMLTRFETLEFLLIVPLVLSVLCLETTVSRKKAFCFTGLFFMFFFGSVIILSFAMKTQNHLLPNYEKYYRIKYQMAKKLFYNEDHFFEQ